MSVYDDLPDWSENFRDYSPPILHPLKNHSFYNLVELVPTFWLSTIAKNITDIGNMNLEKLWELYTTNGFDEPLVIRWNKSNKTVAVTSGHHIIRMAINNQMFYVPAICIVNDETTKNDDLVYDVADFDYIKKESNLLTFGVYPPSTVFNIPSSFPLHEMG